MESKLRTRILELTQADELGRVDLIQPLWNNYGTLSRVYLRGGHWASVIVKHIKIPDVSGHPRGFTGSISRDRKIRSYQVETHWYQNQNRQMPDRSPTPKCLDAFAEGGELFLLLEDLETRGFTECPYTLQWEDVTVVLAWLAGFHAHFLDDDAEGLWPVGTYWHLDTRPEELANIEGTELYRYASLLDARLRCAPFSTLVHGDAKLANFLFTEDRDSVAAVDFQYVGRGAAMKDVAYFVGSCLSGSDCKRLESEILETYFLALRGALPPQVDHTALEVEWRALYPVAWADFQRFMQGWSPGHRKLTGYSDTTTQRAVDAIIDELLAAARRASFAAGAYIQSQRGQAHAVYSKGLSSEASDMVTDIDVQAQALMLDILNPTLETFDLGLLAEEGEQDDSRLSKHAFWTIDPLDGTQYFVEGQAGYATSIALVSQSGQSILGVVYDPVKDQLFEAVAGRGVTLNGERLIAPRRENGREGPIRWFADRSLKTHPNFSQWQAHFDIHFVGGAVMNGLQLLTHPRSVYVKAPKDTLGGCAIWDLAAVSLMLSELDGRCSVYDGSPLELNRSESVYFNDVGLALTTQDVNRDQLLAIL